MFFNKKDLSSEFLPALESSRGIAAFLVVIFHYATAQGPQTGHADLLHLTRNFYLAVDFFFILSGFIMAKIYFNKIAQPADLLKFLALRLGRIYPLHLFWLLVYLALFLILQHGRLTIDQQTLFWPTLFLIYPDKNMFNGPSWSISAEWITYCLFGLHILFLTKLSRLVNVISILGIWLSSYYLLYIQPFELSSTQSGLLRGITGFYIGIIGYLYSKKFNLPKYSAIVFLLVGVYVFFHPSAKEQTNDFLFPLLSIIAVIWLAKENAQKGVLKNPFLVYLGTVSYSVYLGHTFVGLFINKIFERLVTLPIGSFLFYFLLIFKVFTAYLVAHFTYKYIENPFRKNVRKWVDNFKS